MLDLILSTIVFFVAGFFINRYLDDQGLDRGMSRKLLVLMLATLASFAASSATDWVTAELDGSHHTMAAADPLQSGDLSQLVKALGGVQGH